MPSDSGGLWELALWLVPSFSGTSKSDAFIFVVRFCADVLLHVGFDDHTVHNSQAKSAEHGWVGSRLIKRLL